MGQLRRIWITRIMGHRMTKVEVSGGLYTAHRHQRTRRFGRLSITTTISLTMMPKWRTRCPFRNVFGAFGHEICFFSRYRRTLLPLGLADGICFQRLSEVVVCIILMNWECLTTTLAIVWKAKLMSKSG